MSLRDLIKYIYSKIWVQIVSAAVGLRAFDRVHLTNAQ